MILTIVGVAQLSFQCAFAQVSPNSKTIYHQGWIDLNKNRRKDIYEDSKANIDSLAQRSYGQLQCVRNNGAREGDEVVQLYTRDLVSSVTTYEKSLRGFERIHLRPAEMRALTFSLVVL